MRLLGEIVKLQVQTASLKVDTPRHRRYDPSPLREVASMTLSENGVTGWTEDGRELEDVHNLTHPETKNRDGINGISFGFDAHYDAMRTRFDGHLTDGIAGENILVALADPATIFQAEEFLAGVAIETAAGIVRLENVIVAAPCVEFTRFAMRYPDHARPDRTVTEALQFLDDGMRGFYAAYHGPEARISLGNQVFLD
jgi:hypothetical protein